MPDPNPASGQDHRQHEGWGWGVLPAKPEASPGIYRPASESRGTWLCGIVYVTLLLPL